MSASGWSERDIAKIRQMRDQNSKIAYAASMYRYKTPAQRAAAAKAAAFTAQRNAEILSIEQRYIKQLFRNINEQIDNLKNEILQKNNSLKEGKTERGRVYTFDEKKNIKQEIQAIEKAISNLKSELSSYTTRL